MAALPGPVASEEVQDEPSPHVEINGRAQSYRSEASGTPTGEEQALESHEVIELQTFSERKAWIEEKIKFLEALPPIEVFVGLDAIRASAEEVPGLPTREQLQQMVAEHDTIEKQTEIFDTGELKKLRQLTKAATQRNLSPEDTDVIELTLTTIYELDKLLHLLRDRSEHLEMLGIRLTWEENRQSGWKERRQIIEDLHTFLVSRARWSPSIYDLSPKNDDLPNMTRRGSIASQASAGSDSGVTSPAFSRSARFKLAELLSRDAAQFSGRVTSLRHGKVAAGGKALDKLIDHSRKPVPEELLDEQDRFEEKCINDLEHIGKFTMNLVMQWRKADEIYVETMKDHITASNLLEEIETAKLYHPTARQSTSFISRTDTILKRLAVRGDPASPATLFPQPEHFLFPDQKAANGLLAERLSNDISAANKLARKVEFLAKEYRTTYEAVKRVETLMQSMQELTATLLSINKRFHEGVSGGDGDGSPPDLTSELALELTSHSVFLALLPSLLEETALAIDSADSYLRTAPGAILGLDLPGVDHGFKENAAAAVRNLSSLREETVSLKDSITKQVARLKEARRISSTIDSKDILLRTIRLEMARAMDEHRWCQESSNSGAPPTPESPAAELYTPQLAVLDFEDQLKKVNAELKSNIDDPLEKLSMALEPAILIYLKNKISALQALLDSSRRMLRLLVSIKEQSSTMNTIRDEFHQLLVRMEDTKLQITSMVTHILGPSLDDDVNVARVRAEELESIRKEVTTFIEGLSTRVPFIARHSPPTRSSSLKSPLFSHGSNGSIPQVDFWSEIPFDLITVDAAVRADSNSYAMRLNGNVEDMLQTKAHLDLAALGKRVDVALSLTLQDTNGIDQELFGHKKLFASVARQTLATINQLQAISSDLNHTQSKRPAIARSLSPIRDILRQMDEKSRSLPPPIRENIYQSRNSATDDAELQLSSWDGKAESLQSDISLAIDAELRYQEEVRAEEQRRKREEDERLAVEEAEHLQLEQERLEKEKKQRLLEEKLAEEHRLELDRKRIAAELALKERQEREAAEAERLHVEEEGRKAEAARILAEQERLAKEEEERVLRERERLEMFEKLRAAEAKLEEERRLHAESERAAMELAKKQQLEMEELEKRQAEMQTLAEERARQEEKARLERERERELLEMERQRLERKAQQQAEKEALEMVAKEAREREEMEAQKREVKEARERSEKESQAKAKKLEKDEKERLEREAKEKRERERNEKAKAREAQDHRDFHHETSSLHNNDEDVFGVQKSPSDAHVPLSQAIAELQGQILTLRKRLRSICINESVRPTKSSTNLPSEEQLEKMARDFQEVSNDTENLPFKTENINIDIELQSLRTEVHESARLLKELRKLVDMTKAIRACDDALSDLLEHIDSYPAPPLGVLSSSHKSLPTAHPEEQLAARLDFTREAVASMAVKLDAVSKDRRALSEHGRIQQTWTELHEMALDRIGGKKSRPGSVISRTSSGRKSSASGYQPPTHSRGARKVGSYSNLSVSSTSTPTRGKMLAPPQPSTRRAVSGSADTPNRSTSRLSSVSTNRSVSGPLNASLYGSTFASRQRTTSLSNSPVISTPRRPSLAPTRLRVDSENKRSHSPTMSEKSAQSYNPSNSRSTRAPSRSSINSSTWSRAPRESFSSLLPRVTTPSKKASAPPRKKYVADPKSKLDVAVGDVVNQLPVGINIEGITESWRDQSGKYWIGNQDAKLCFCRILRSQTVMVRVGGGWTELSRFIRDHFAESFRIAPESPPRHGAQEEKWINSSTLLELRESDTHPPAPRTPEPTFPFVPSFALMTPSGQSPHSLKSSSSNAGSPLTALQFIRRAEPDPLLLRPITPSKAPLRSRVSASNNSRNSVWRP